MALEQRGFSIGHRVAAADLSTKQFYLVKIDGNGKIALAGAGEFAVGVLQNTPAADEACDVMVFGVSKVVVSGALNSGDPIASDASGKAKAAVAGKTDTSDAGVAADALLGSYVVGTLLADSGADTTYGTLLLTHSGAVPTTVS